MKILFYLILLFCNVVFSQNISGVILDSLSEKPMDLVSLTFLKSKFCFFSNNDGKFNLDINQINDTLLVSNIGYESKKILFDKLKNGFTTIKLIPKVIQLDEVLIFNKVKKYLSPYLIKTEIINVQNLGFQFGTEHIKLVENPKNIVGKFSSIIIDLKRDKKHAQGNKQWKIDYLATYSIRFYEYDTIKQRPSNELFSKNIIVQPQNKTYRLKIDVDSLNIRFPKEGACVGLEIINTKYKNPKTTFAIIVPSIKFTEHLDQSKAKSWVRYRNEGWIFKSQKTRNKNGNYSINKMIVIDANVKYEKK